jgi:hypothetical protein
VVYDEAMELPAPLDRVSLSAAIFKIVSATKIAGSSGITLNRDMSFAPADASEAAKRDQQTGTLVIRRPGAGTIECSPVTLTADALAQLGITLPPEPEAVPEAVTVDAGGVQLSITRTTGRDVERFTLPIAQTPDALGMAGTEHLLFRLLLTALGGSVSYAPAGDNRGVLSVTVGGTVVSTGPVNFDRPALKALGLTR